MPTIQSSTSVVEIVDAILTSEFLVWGSIISFAVLVVILFWKGRY